MDECKLSDKKCGPCNKETPRLGQEESERYRLLIPGWTLVWGHKIERVFTFKNFRAAMAFINQIAIIAEAENHHPDFFLHNYRHVDVSLTTHAIHGLSENDFIVAAKIDALLP